jgi:hypothetical protein
MSERLRWILLILAVCLFLNIPNVMAQTYSDTFDRANSTTLGSSWVEKEDVAGFCPGALQIASNAGWTVRCHGAFAYWNDTTTNDQSSKLIYGGSALVNGNRDNGGPAVRINSGGAWNSASLYMAEYDRLKGKVRVWKYLNQSLQNPGTQLGSDVTATLATGDSFEIRAIGTTISVLQNNVTLISVTDTSLSAGSVGMAVRDLTLDPGDPTGTGGIGWTSWTGGSYSSAYSDSFERADGVNLGASWIEQEDVSGFCTGSLQIYNGAAWTVRCHGSFAYWNATFPSDQTSKLIYGGSSFANSNRDHGGPAVRINTAGTWNNASMYMAEYDRLQNKVRLWKYVSQSLNGAGTQLGSDVAASLTAGDALEIRASGTTITVLKNAATLISVTDSSLSSGSAGMAVRNLTLDPNDPTGAGGLGWTSWSGGPYGTTDAVRLVQSSLNFGTAVTSVSSQFSEANTAGNLIIAFVRASQNAQTVTISDTAGNSYVEAVNHYQSLENFHIHIYYATNIAGRPNLVKATFSGSNDHPLLAIFEYSGLSPSVTLDKTTHAEGADASPASGSTAMTTSASELVFAAASIPYYSTATISAGNGYTMQRYQDTGSPAATETQIAASAGTFNGTFSLSASAGWAAIIATFKATTGPSITTTSLPKGIKNRSYNANLTASGGRPNYSWSVLSGSLPAGLSLSSSAGVISGTPTTTGTSTFTVQVSDGNSQTASQGLTIEIIPDLPTITTTALPSGTSMSAYTSTLTATGGTTPYTWSVFSGSLPPGLSLSSSGTISGTPTTTGGYSFTIQVADAGARTATQPLAITVNSGSTSSLCNQNALNNPPSDANGTSNYYTFVPPAVGKSFRSYYCSDVKRLSDAINGDSTWVHAEYATQNHFNANNTKIEVQAQGHTHIIDLNGNILKELQIAESPNSPRWDRSDPNKLWCHKGNQFGYFDVSAASPTFQAVKTLSEYGNLIDLGEPDISPDGNKFVWLSDTGDVFVLSRPSSTGAWSKGPVLNVNGQGLVQIHLTNNYVVLGYQQKGATPAQKVYDLNMNYLRTLTNYREHADVGTDFDGTEILVTANANESDANCQNALVKFRLSDGARTCLLPNPGSPIFAWEHIAVHIAVPMIGNGWVYVETYDDADWVPGTADWKVYFGEVLAIKLDGSGTIRRLAHHYSRFSPADGYNYQPRVSVNADGTKVLFNSNFGLQSKLNPPADSSYTDTYLIEGITLP